MCYYSDMKVWFEHPYGRMDYYNMQWCKVYADVEPEEQEQALAQGFIDLGDHWKQVRSSRINIKNYIKETKPVKTPKGVTVEKWSGSFGVKHKDLLDGIMDQYLTHHNFSDYYMWSSYDIDDKETFYCYYDADKIVAWSVWSKYGHSVDNWQFAWDYGDPSLRLGTYSLDHEIRIAHEKKYNWFYLGESYATSSAYKSKIAGFEWWTGKEWSTDMGLFDQHLKADEFVETLEDLQSVHDSIYGLHKPN